MQNMILAVGRSKNSLKNTVLECVYKSPYSKPEPIIKTESHLSLRLRFNGKF